MSSSPSKTGDRSTTWLYWLYWLSWLSWLCQVHPVKQVTAWLLSPPSKTGDRSTTCTKYKYTRYSNSAGVECPGLDWTCFFLVFFFNLSRKVCRPVPMRKVLRLHNPQQSKFNLQPQLNPRQLETTNQGCWIMFHVYLLLITFTIYLNITIIFITIQKIKKRRKS